MTIKSLLILSLACGLALAPSGCGKSEKRPSDAGLSAGAGDATNAPAVSTFDSTMARAKSLMNEGKFAEARDELRSTNVSALQLSAAEHKQLAELKVQIARGAGAARSKGGTTNTTGGQ